MPCRFVVGGRPGWPADTLYTSGPLVSAETTDGFDGRLNWRSEFKDWLYSRGITSWTLLDRVPTADRADGDESGRMCGIRRTSGWRGAVNGTAAVACVVDNGSCPCLRHTLYSDRHWCCLVWIGIRILDTDISAGYITLDSWISVNSASRALLSWKLRHVYVYIYIYIYIMTATYSGSTRKKCSTSTWMRLFNAIQSSISLYYLTVCSCHGQPYSQPCMQSWKLCNATTNVRMRAHA